MDPEITGEEVNVAEGWWNKGAFQPVPYNAYCYLCFSTCI